MMMTNAIKKAWRFIKWNLFLRKNNFDENKWYFVLNYGIGDTYMVSALALHIVKKYKKVVFIIEKSSHRFIPKMFSSEVEIYDEVDLPWNLIEEFGQFIPGNPIVLHPSHLLHKNLLTIIGFKGVNLLDMYKMLLGLNMSCLPTRPNFTNSYTTQIATLFSDNNLIKGKTVLLCPQANSVKHLDINFWQYLAGEIMQAGLVPIFLNIQVESFSTINFPLHYADSFIESAGHMVSLRSGFCDLVSTSRARKVILYPDELWFSGQLFESTSLSRLQLCADDNLKELEFNFEDLVGSQLSHKIVNLLTWNK